MNFLIPAAGVDTCYGVLTSPAHRGVVSTVKAGGRWAADNGAFSDAFDGALFLAWLDTMLPYRKRCLFVAVPDVVADVSATLARWNEYAPLMVGWPLAYVAQDGSEHLPIPPDAIALFVGGSTAWKLSEQAASVIRRAQEAGLRIHIGRVNWWRRYEHFRGMAGSDAFTCDGTRVRYERDAALAAWAEYPARPYQMRLL